MSAILHLFNLGSNGGLIWNLQKKLGLRAMESLNSDSEWLQATAVSGGIWVFFMHDSIVQITFLLFFTFILQSGIFSPFCYTFCFWQRWRSCDPSSPLLLYRSLSSFNEREMKVSIKRSSLSPSLYLYGAFKSNFDQPYL